VIAIRRLALEPATPVLLRAAMAGPAPLGEALGAVVPATWPPDYLDHDAFRYVLDRLAEAPDEAGWWLHCVLLRRPETRTLIGSAGYKGPPNAERTVEIGDGIVAERCRRGYASEAVGGLLTRAFTQSGIDRLPELEPSIGVLTKSGFRLLGTGSEPGVIRFELTRAEYIAAATTTTGVERHDWRSSLE
jgi:RimJ/RimL family protein N-acetyltransferase